MDCIARSRTDYYTANIALFVLPMAIVLYIAAIRGLVWVLRPAALFVMPQLAGHAFFDHAVHERTSALSFDVSHTQFPRGACLPSARASSLMFKQGCAAGRYRADRGKWSERIDY